MENPFPRAKPRSSKPAYKQQGKFWVFTVYDVLENGAHLVSTLHELRAAGIVEEFFYGSEECPTTGTPHIHAGLVFNQNFRYNAVKKLMLDKGIQSFWMELMVDWDAALEYAFKDETPDLSAQEGWPIPRWFKTCDRPARLRHRPLAGASPKKKSRRQSYRVSEEQATMLLTGQTDKCLSTMTATEALSFSKVINQASEIVPDRVLRPLVLWLYGPTRVGKTSLALLLQRRLQVPTHWQGLEENGKFWNGYNGQEIIVLEEARPHSLPMATFLRLANEAPYRVEIKGSSRPVDSPLIIITTPSPPWNFWPESVDQPGHVNDINQVLGRISLLVEVLPRNTVELFLIASKEPQKDTRAPGATGTMNHPHPELEEASNELARILDWRRRNASWPEGVAFTFATKQKPPALTSQRLKNHHFLPVRKKTILMPPDQRLIQAKNLSSAQPPLLPSSPRSETPSTPQKRKQITSPIQTPLSASSSISALSEKNQTTNQLSSDHHWRQNVRLPSGMSQELVEKCLDSLSADKEFVWSFVVRSICFETDAHSIFCDHYFGDMFFDREADVEEDYEEELL